MSKSKLKITFSWQTDNQADKVAKTPLKKQTKTGFPKPVEIEIKNKQHGLVKKIKAIRKLDPKKIFDPGYIPSSFVTPMSASTNRSAKQRFETQCVKKGHINYFVYKYYGNIFEIEDEISNSLWDKYKGKELGKKLGYRRRHLRDYALKLAFADMNNVPVSSVNDIGLSKVIKPFLAVEFYKILKEYHPDKARYFYGLQNW